MPFQVFKQLKHVGNISPDDKFEIVMENGAKLIGSIAYVHYPTTLALCLHKAYWTNEVTMACNSLLAELRGKYPDYDIQAEHVEAWIRTARISGPPNELVVGTPAFSVEVQYGVWQECRTLFYTSRIIDLKPLP